MPRGRRTRLAMVLLVLAALAIGGAALLRAQHRAAMPARPPEKRPTLLLLTSLPLVFGERLSLDTGGSPALSALERRYVVTPIAVADPSALKQARLLLMAHASAQPAENLVALDAWVRAGGRLLLLADPLLEWDSARPLGDPLRPSPMFPDTGLLAHWGLRLDTADQRGPVIRMMGGREVMTLSPGRLTGTCMVSADYFIADCRIGHGRAIVVADADFLDVDQVGGSGANLDALLAELASLEQ